MVNFGGFGEFRNRFVLFLFVQEQSAPIVVCRPQTRIELDSSLVTRNGLGTSPG